MTPRTKPTPIGSHRRIHAFSICPGSDHGYARIHGPSWELARREGALPFELRAALELTRRTADPRQATHLAAAIQRFPSTTGYSKVDQGRALA
jgi:hypothetical protein